MTAVILASTTTTIAVLGLIVITLGWIVYGIFNVAGGRKEVGSEIELAANRKPYYDDETLEGPRLERVQLMGVLLLAVIVVALPLYWVFEPSRQAGAQEGWDNRFASWGSQLFAPTADGGFNCAGCHGGMGAVGGEAPFTVTDPQTGQIEAVNWKAPALNTVFYRFTDDEVRFILNYGRPFSPMSPWGLVGGGPMNTQQIDNLIAYMHSIQVPREDCLEGEDPLTCDSGHLPPTRRPRSKRLPARRWKTATPRATARRSSTSNIASGAYSCARCHTLGWSYDKPTTSGQGAFGWNLTGGSVNNHFASEADMVAFIKTGSEHGQALRPQRPGQRPHARASAPCSPMSRSKPSSNTYGACDRHVVVGNRLGAGDPRPAHRHHGGGGAVREHLLHHGHQHGGAARVPRGARLAVRLDDADGHHLVDLRHRPAGPDPTWAEVPGTHGVAGHRARCTAPASST